MHTDDKKNHLSTTHQISEKFPAPKSIGTSQLSADYAKWEIALYIELSKARDIQEFVRKITIMVQQMGFSDFSFVRLAQKNGLETSLWTTPPELHQYYVDNELWSYDLLLLYASINTQPMYQSVIDSSVTNVSFETPAIKKNRLALKFFHKLGFLEDYNIPLQSTNGNGNVLLTVATRHLDGTTFQQRVEPLKEKLAILCRAIDCISLSRFPEAFLDADEERAMNIGPKPLLLLNVLAQDLTLTEAAAQLNISIKTANKHIANARDALSVKTTHGAVRKALQLGLINSQL